MNNVPSDTYRKLYYEIIDPLLAEVCDSGLNYCVKDLADGLPVPIAIYRKYEKYRNKALNNMHGSRLDRHKLASCICGAIIETGPLVGRRGAKVVKVANEIFALYVGLNVIKAYMVYGFIEREGIASGEKEKLLNYFKESFEMKFPDNICDTQEYIKNFANALYWSHFTCDITGRECFRYDIWAYSKIFYHLELFNRPLLRQSYERYGSSL